MRNDVNRQWLLTSRPQDMIDQENFSWVEHPIPTLEDGQVLVRNLWLSFDPTQRPWMSFDTYVPMIPLGEVMRAIGVGQVVDSRRAAERFPEAMAALSNWLAEGKLKQKEDVAHGLENAPSTLIRLFTGQNFGKQLLKIADPPLLRVD
jgi:NADPH-dependent curcumin reductase CurA